MSHPFIITSGAFVDSELVAEFGLLPPAFLPLGSRRLFLRQHQAVSQHASRIILTVPASFTPDPHDAAMLNDLNVEVLGVPEGLTLGQSVVYAINATATGSGPVSILHGDSLLTDFAYETLDAVSVTNDFPPPGYSWAWAVQGDDGLKIVKSSKADDQALTLTGYFSVSDGARLVQCITRNNSDFIVGLAEYASIKPMQALTSGHWFDFGHCSTYHRSRRLITTEREFNRLSGAGRSISKSGTNAEKLRAEAAWYENLPLELRVYTPAYLGRTETADSFNYSLEYLHLPSLADLSVFGRLERTAWNRIFESCDETLSALAAVPGPESSLASARSLLLEKTLQRLERLATSLSIDLSAPCRLGERELPSLQRMAEIAASSVSEPDRVTLVHGDFCFSNILYDMRADTARMIDPRGIDANGLISAYGDIRYDVAKLHHSAVGLYDHIIAGNYAFRRNGDLHFDLDLPKTRSIQLIQEAFLARTYCGKSVADAAALPISILLFLSMPPLHADDPRRQMALLANALRLFLLLEPTGV